MLQHRQMPGVGNDLACSVFLALVRLEQAPESLDESRAFHELFHQQTALLAALPLAVVPISATEDCSGIVWEDENNHEWLHLL